MNASCAELRFVKKHKGIDPEFKPYVERFVIDSKGKIKKEDLRRLSIGFRDYKDIWTVGTCHPIAKEIDINRAWWNYTYSDLHRMELVYHELGHCLLHRHHTTPTSGKNKFMADLERFMFEAGLWDSRPNLFDGCPPSIMHPKVVSERCMLKHYDFYIHELFSEVKYADYTSKRLSIYYSQGCEKPEVINHTDEWNEGDQSTLDRAKMVCRERYKACLGTFIKKDNYTYNAICR